MKHEPAAGPASANAFAADLFAGLPDRYDLLAEVLSFWQNAAWRRELVSHLAAGAPAHTLDVATGTAGVAIEVARSTGGRVLGIDLSERMLRRGRARVARAGLDELIALRQGRAEELPLADSSFDAVSFTYLLRYVGDPALTIRELVRVLRPGGTLASLDFNVPDKALWRALWQLYTRIVLPPAAGALGGRPWFRVGRFLGPSISEHRRRWPLARLEQVWREAGMTRVEHRVMSAGAGVVMWGTKAGE